MKTNILIKGGTLINHNETKSADILIKNGLISEIRPSILLQDDVTETIDAAGKYVIPGGIDPHVHFALQTPLGKTIDDFDKGSKKALLGGTTCFIDFVTPLKGETLAEAFSKRLKEAENSHCDYLLHGSVTQWTPNTFSDLKLCRDLFGMTSVKVYTAYTDSIGLKTEDLEKVMQAAAKLNLLMLVHCEDDGIVIQKRQQLLRQGKTKALFHPQSRPPKAEIKAIEKMIALAKKTNCRLYIVHVSTPEGVNLIYEAVQNGMDIKAETCTQYLLLNDTFYDDDTSGNNYILSPPLRSEKSRINLWAHLSKGHFDVVATDHCAFGINQKNNDNIKNFAEVPNGIAGVENRLQLLFEHGVKTGRITLQHFVALTSTHAAKAFGLFPQKGIIATGSDADILIFDPLKTAEIKQLDTSEYNVYQGLKCTPLPEIAIMKGSVVLDNFKLQKLTSRALFLGHRSLG